MDDQKNIEQNVEIPSVKETSENVAVPVKPEIHENVPAPVTEQPTAPLVAPTLAQTPATVQPEPVISVPDPLPEPAVQNGANDLDAEEGDIIEKPWVKKAEDIISENKNDPYEQEEEQENLQIDYMKKRFGKNLKKTEE